MDNCKNEKVNCVFNKKTKNFENIQLRQKKTKSPS